MATRELTWHTDSGERAVLIRVWQPVTFRRDIYCDYAIDGLQRRIRGASIGADSLQALTIVLRAIWLELAPLREELYWGEARGWLGMSFCFDYPDDFAQQRRVERLVENEEKRYFDRVSRPHMRRETRLRRLYDPDDREAEYARCSTDELIEELRVAAARERQYRNEGDEEGAAVYQSKRWPIVGTLKERYDYREILETMTGDEDPGLRFLAAQMLSDTPLSQATLIRLRDENVEPEATEARRLLEFRQRSAARPRPWDDEDGAT